MSFIKRADGTTIYAGSHATVRPSLADIRHGGAAANQPETPEERMWLKQVIAAMMPLGEAVCYDDPYWSEEAEIIAGLWGIYYNTCPTVQRNFNDEYFSPSDH
jgi:hypothetical protein